MKSMGTRVTELGSWTQADPPPVATPAALRAALADLISPVALVDLDGRLGIGSRGAIEPNGAGRSETYPLRGFAPSLPPAALGDATFRSTYGVRFAYVAGAMANAISSETLVEALAAAGMLAIFGAAGCTPQRIEAAIDRLQSTVGEGPWGVNLIHSPGEPALEATTVDLCLARQVKTVSASAYMDLTLPVVRYRTHGIHQGADGQIIVPNRLLAKVSRPEVARRFLEPPPASLVDRLVERGDLTRAQAALTGQIPMADDVTAEADSGGHTDNRPLVVLLPELCALRDRVVRNQGYVQAPRIGAAGGISTPAAAAAAFGMGAAYVLTGSVNQACVESGSSDRARDMLAQASSSDVAMAPAADMFEMGVRVQVLGRGTMFPVRARKLYTLFNAYDRIEALPAHERAALERSWFRCSLNDAWEACVRFWADRDASQLEMAERDPRHKMALLFRAYLGQSSQWANEGIEDRAADFQIWCGPAMGAFNDWVRGSALEPPRARTAVGVALNLLAGAALTTRTAALRAQGVALPAGIDDWRPLGDVEMRALAAQWEADEGGRAHASERGVSTTSVAPARAERFEPIAIVGMGCAFPKAPDLTAYWRLLRRGIDAVEAIPATHFDPEDYDDADPHSPDRTRLGRGGFLNPCAFDPTAFALPPNALEATDTAQLLGLMVAKQTLRDAGLDPDGPEARGWDRARTAVILGVTGSQELVVTLGARLGHPHWWRALRQAGVDDETAQQVVDGIGRAYPAWQESSFPGLLGNVVAGRIANRFDLGGTNCVLDAACASSLAAIHLACLELQTHRADRVLTGGVDTFSDIFMHMCFGKTQALSPTGDARPFAAAADGTILGEGLGMLLLRRLGDAEADRDRIYAVIRGIGTASDGRAKSIYAPKPEGQARALRNAYHMAEIRPGTVDLVEAHGTGTQAGDACEVEALSTIFKQDRADLAFCALGSVKSQIGHTKAAAGSAGLLKAALALHHKVIPPTLKVEAPNPALDLGQSPFYLSTETRPWLQTGAHPRRAAVSAFGFGGSDFHLVAEEYRPHRVRPAWDRAVEIVPLSADDPQDLLNLLNLNHDLAQAAREARAHFVPTAKHRLVLVTEDDASLGEILAVARKGIAERPDVAWRRPGSIHYGVGPVDGKLAFLFPGQGSQYVGMLAGLACVFPELLSSLQTDPALAATLLPPPTFDAAERERRQDRLTATDRAQPALALVEAVWPSNHFSEYTISLRATFVKGEKGGMTVRLGRAR